MDSFPFLAPGPHSRPLLYSSAPWTPDQTFLRTFLFLLHGGPKGKKEGQGRGTEKDCKVRR